MRKLILFCGFLCLFFLLAAVLVGAYGFALQGLRIDSTYDMISLSAACGLIAFGWFGVGWFFFRLFEE